MPHTRYGVSYWLHSFPRSRQPSYPRLRGHLDVDVAIVGGGLTGAMAAYVFAASGIRVALLESDRIGAGATAASPGMLQQAPHSSFVDLEARYGRRAARRIYQMMRRASLDTAATLRRLRIRCDLTAVDTVHLALAPEERRFLEREYRSRRDSGLEVGWLSSGLLRRDLRFAAEGGLRLRGDARLDPYRACLGVMAAAAKRGALIHERSAVVRVRAGRKAVEIRTNGGTLRVSTIVIATGYPTPEFKPLRRHFTRLATYVAVTAPLPAAVRRELAGPSIVLRDSAAPPHVVRWSSDDRLMIAGADQRVPAHGRDKVLLQRTGQLMYELSVLYPAISGTPPAHGWDAEFGETADTLPYLGPHRNYPRHLFAFGLGRNGVAPALLASRILLRHYRGEPARGDELFGFTR